VTEHGTFAAGKYGGDPPAELVDFGSTDSEHAAIQAMKPAVLESMSDGVPGQPRRDELVPSDHPVLLSGQPPQRRVHRCSGHGRNKCVPRSL